MYARRRIDLALTPAEREYLSYRDDRSEFDGWITQIRLPASVHEREESTASSLQDLVDFAIDNDTGVVEDPTTDAFHAVTPAVLYTYRPPSLDTAAVDSDRDVGGVASVDPAAEEPVAVDDGQAGRLPDEAWGDGSEDVADDGDEDVADDGDEDVADDDGGAVEGGLSTDGDDAHGTHR